MRECATLRSEMEHDLIATAEAAALLGKSVATINRWAAEDKLKPALTLPGDKGARLFRRSDVEAFRTDEPTEAAG